MAASRRMLVVCAVTTLRSPTRMIRTPDILVFLPFKTCENVLTAARTPAHRTSAHRTSAHRPAAQRCVWPQPGKEPLKDIHRAVLVAVHHQPTGPTAIRALPQGHRLPVPAPRAVL